MEEKSQRSEEPRGQFQAGGAAVQGGGGGFSGARVTPSINQRKKENALFDVLRSIRESPQFSD